MCVCVCVCAPPTDTYMYIYSFRSKFSSARPGLTIFLVRMQSHF